jgi:c-di-GMP-binding flagellar brake protein YcgR
MINEEKRKHSRIDSLHLLNYLYTEAKEEGAMQGMGRTLNISESGVLLETHTPISVGVDISLTIGFEEEMVDIKGRVVYTKENNEDMYESGIEFDSMDKASQDILYRYIAAFNAQ